MNNPLKSRRDDLQCWRSVAIVAVLLFHIWPEWFPNGYLGVDIFFVLSGFLMAAIIHKNPRVDLQVTVDFYYRRVKRIVPIYFLFILSTLLCVSRVLWLEEYSTAEIDSRWAASFLTNIQSIVRNLDYFDMSSRHRFFRHCWSLSVEMQFYLLVPILFFLWINRTPKMKLSLILVIFAISFCCSIYLQYYELTISRIWQFMAGILAQSYPIQCHGSSMRSKFCFTCCLVVMFIPIRFHRSLASLVAITTSGFLIASSSNGLDSPFRNILKVEIFGKPLVFLGDISYVLYLVHWPIVTYLRFTMPKDEIGFFHGISAFSLSIVLSIFIYMFIEKPTLSSIRSKKELFLYCLVLSIGIYYTPNLLKNYTYQSGEPSMEVKALARAVHNFTSTPTKPLNWTLEDEFQLNFILSRETISGQLHCLKTHQKYTNIQFRKKMQLCETVRNDSSMNLTGVIIGNSHALTGSPIVHHDIRFKRVIRISASSCAFPNDECEYCKDTEKINIEILQKVHPDIVFLFFAYMRETPSLSQPENTEDDDDFVFLNNTVGEISKYTKAIIINGMDVKFPLDITPEYLRRKANGLDIESLKFPREVILGYEPVIDRRLATLLKYCPKCVIVRPSEAFCDDLFCDPIDRNLNLPMFRDYGHIRAMGQRRYKIFVDRAIEETIAKLNL